MPHRRSRGSRPKRAVLVLPLFVIVVAALLFPAAEAMAQRYGYGYSARPAARAPNRYRRRRHIVRGAGRGAALGAVGGAITGDAGKGAAAGAAMGGMVGVFRERDYDGAVWPE